MDYIFISGVIFIKFSNDSFGGNFMRDYFDWDLLIKIFLEKEKKKMDKSGFRILFFRYEDIYNGFKFFFFENLFLVLKIIKIKKSFLVKLEIVDFMNFVMDEVIYF